MAAKIEEVLGIEAELVEGDRGIFDVVADGAVVFSKHSEGRFPDDPEIIDALRQRLPGE